MGELGAELAALWEHHQRVGSELADQLVRDGDRRALAMSHREMRWLSGPRVARLYRQGLDGLPDDGRVSAAVCLLADVSAGRYSAWSRTRRLVPPATLLAVRAARPRFELADLRLLLGLDSAWLSGNAPARIEYLGVVLDRALDLLTEGVEGATSVRDEVAAVCSNWRPEGLANRDVVAWQELQERAGRPPGGGSAVGPQVNPVERSDGFGAAVLDLLGDSDPWPTPLVALLTHAGSARSSVPSAIWETRFVQLAGAVDDAGDLVRSLLELLTTAPPVMANAYGGIRPMLLDANDDLARGLVWGAAILGESWTPEVLRRVAGRCLREAKGRSVRSVTVRGEKVPFACFYALGRIATHEAISVLGQFRQTVDNRTVLHRIDAALEPLAAARGMSVDRLVEAHISHYELDLRGQRKIPLGDGAAVLRLDDRVGARLSWVDAEGVEESMPDGIGHSHPDEVAEVGRVWSDLKKASRTERERIESLLAGRREWSAAEFSALYSAHPLAGWYGRRLLWTAKCADGRAVVGLPSERHGLSMVTVSGAEHVVPERSAVSIWHPADADDDQVKAARSLLSDRGVIQPFRQAWREIYRPDDLELANDLYSDRFAGHILHRDGFYALSKRRGWTANYVSSAWDGGQAAHARRDFPDQGISAVWAVTALDWEQPTDLCVSDRVHFEPTGEVRPAPVPISQVTGRVFSETMRDIDLFVSTCTIANDPLWIEHVATERRLGEYWEKVAADGLGTLISLRHHALDQLLAEGDLLGPFDLEGRFLVVRGHRGTYKIELTTANVLLDPPGRWLSIPQRSSPAATDAVLQRLGWAADDDDTLLTRIVTRARLLAADDKIRDKRFLEQLSPPQPR